MNIEEKLILYWQYHKNDWSLIKNKLDEDTMIRLRRDVEKEKEEGIICPVKKDEYKKLLIEYGIEKEEEFKLEEQFVAKYPQDLPRVNEKREWLIEGLFYEKTFNQLFATAKAGKTCFSTEMAYCLSNGIPFLGHKTKKVDCLYLDFEMTDPEIGDREKQIEYHYNDKNGNNYYKYITFADKEHKPEPEDIFKIIYKNLEINPNIKFILIDNIFAMYDDLDPSDMKVVKKSLRELKFKCCMKMGMTVLFVNHTPKPFTGKSAEDDAKQPLSKNDILSGYTGSMAIGNFIDRSIMLKSANRSGSVIQIGIAGRGAGCIFHMAELNVSTDFCFKVNDEIDIKDVQYNVDYYETPRTRQERIDKYLKNEVGKNSTTIRNLQNIFNITTPELKNLGYDENHMVYKFNYKKIDDVIKLRGDESV